MKTTTLHSIVLLSFVLSLPLAHAQTTAFTYQGRLNNNGSPFTGSAEFQPTLWDAATNGNQLAVNSPAQLIAPVTNGLFTLTLDFGANFPGANRWLQMEVRTTIGSFTLLTPRQQLTPTPYAITASSASNLTGTLPAAQLSGAISSANFVGTYSSALTLNNAGNSFSGNGAGLTGVNSDLLDGFDSSSFWKLGGNGSTIPDTHFLGTTDNQPLQVRVNNQRSWRIEYATNGVNFESPNLIAGRSNNTVAVGVVGATISGGGRSGNSNSISADFGTVGGGWGNRVGIGSGDSTIAGGSQNMITNSFQGTIGGGSLNKINGTGSFLTVSTIGGGINNTIGVTNLGSSSVILEGGHFIGGGNRNRIGQNLLYASINGGTGNQIDSGSASIGGGQDNVIEVGGFGSVISGGSKNTNNGNYASIPGGERNAATGNYAFASGRRAKANHNGAFVWADSTDADFASTAVNQFLVRAGGGMGIGVTQPRGELHVGTSSNVVPQSTATQTVLIENAAENGRAAFIALAGPGASDSTNRVELQFEANENERRAILGTVSNHEIQVRQDNSVRLTVWTNGFVGIGTSTPTNRLMVVNARCDGSSWINSSDRNLKENFAPVNPREILAKVVAMPISRWNYKDNPGTPHVGPVAQDFKTAFSLGADDVSIATVDADGVALAAIQGLNQKVDFRSQKSEGRIEKLETENAELKERLEKLEQLLHHKLNGGVK